MILENRRDYINYRFRKAEEALDEALILAEKEKWNGVVNRLYYACFYAVIALLVKNDVETLTHDGARTQFGLRFVKTKIVSRDMGRLYTKLFDFRQKGDYGDFFDFEEATVRPLIAFVKAFISELKVLVYQGPSS